MIKWNNSDCTIGSILYETEKKYEEEAGYRVMNTKREDRGWVWSSNPGLPDLLREVFVQPRGIITEIVHFDFSYCPVCRRMSKQKWKKKKKKKKKEESNLLRKDSVEGNVHKGYLKHMRRLLLAGRD